MCRSLCLYAVHQRWQFVRPRQAAEVSAISHMPQEAVEQQQQAAAEVRAAAAEVRAAAAAPVTLGEEQWSLLGRRLAALQSELEVWVYL